MVVAEKESLQETLRGYIFIAEWAMGIGGARGRMQLWRTPPIRQSHKLFRASEVFLICSFYGIHMNGRHDTKDNRRPQGVAGGLVLRGC